MQAYKDGAVINYALAVYLFCSCSWAMHDYSDTSMSVLHKGSEGALGESPNALVKESMFEDQREMVRSTPGPAKP